MTRELLLGNQSIPFTVHYTARRTLGITVHPDGSVIVTAPAGTPDEIISARLHRRASWILRTRRDFDAMRPKTAPRRYVPGETYRFLGREYRLRVEPELPCGVTLTATHLVVGGLSHDEPSRVRNRLQNWYHREARRIMAERYAEALKQHRIAGPLPRLVVRPLQKRWGSLTAGGRTLVLNRRLVEADIASIDYVITHELCHLTYDDHGPRFLTLLAARLPDWSARKQRLERWMR